VTSSFVNLRWAGRPVDIEYTWVGGANGTAPVGGLDSTVPVLVFLHEGLGSVSMWRDFPAQLCTTLGCRGLVYSRPGYGRSTPRAAGERWGNDFMHRQAHEVLPALLDALELHAPVDLFGHSDGGSIALLFAAHQPQRVRRVVVLAPHIMVEEVGLASIRQAREQYFQGGLRERLARHHADVDSAFLGWNDVWLSPGFVRWQITSDLKYIASPVLAVQGLDDVYGTMAQIDNIAAAVPGTQLLKLPDCGHSPHRDQPRALIEAAQRFLTPTPQPHGDFS
jgi:pimeloyl-ACP methyl ester carboxylesterase